jgi:hypothetical protein
MQHKFLNCWDADTIVFYIFSETPYHVQARANIFIFNEEHSMENSKTEPQTSANTPLTGETFLCNFKW